MVVHRRSCLLTRYLFIPAQVNARMAEDIRSDLASKTTSDGMKEILELEYKVGLLELENMELEYSRMLHELVVRRKDMKLRKFKLMVSGARTRVRCRGVMLLCAVVRGLGVGTVSSSEFSGVSWRGRAGLCKLVFSWSAVVAPPIHMHVCWRTFLPFFLGTLAVGGVLHRAFRRRLVAIIARLCWCYSVCSWARVTATSTSWRKRCKRMGWATWCRARLSRSWTLS